MTTAPFFATPFHALLLGTVKRQAKLGEGAIADAVIDRIVYRSDTIHIEGDESMRKCIGQGH